MIAQYSPSVAEFLLVYFVLAAAIIWLQTTLLRWFLPQGSFVITSSSSRGSSARPHAD